MKYSSSAFESDRAKLSFIDILRLLIGLEVTAGPLVVGLYRMPCRFEGPKNIANAPHGNGQ